MPRKKLSEYRSKLIISDILKTSYIGWSITDDIANLDAITGYDSYVVKVDQAIKGRFKKGLVTLDVAGDMLLDEIDKMRKQGYTSFIIEPFMLHDDSQEKYLAITQDRDGMHINVSDNGGVDIEQNHDTIKQYAITDDLNWEQLASHTSIEKEKIQQLVAYFQDNYLTLLEINPYVINERGMNVLDIAIEVDDAGRFFVDSWTEADIRNPRSTNAYKQELAVRSLDQESSASFNLSVLNPNGSIFLLLSGGGASVVIADEIFNLGLGEELANYGEYSGNPNTHETYLYTREVFSLIADSSAKQKVIFIGGAVANFTDIASTFEGIIKAIDEAADILKRENVKVYVRRGGPRQQIGLAKIETSLKTHGLFGGVYTPDVSISKAVRNAVEGIKSV